MARKKQANVDLDSATIRPVSEADASVILKGKSKRKAEPLRDLEQEELEALQHDLETARQIQQKLLPERVPMIPGYEFDAYYSTAGVVGGDFYDFIEFDRNTLGIIVADSAGKGLAGALLMVEARAVIRAMCTYSKSPKEILVRANKVLHGELKRGSFITIFFALMDLSKGVIKVASAGHDPMLLWKWKKKQCYAVNPSGLVLGAASEEMFKETLKEKEITLEPGDRFVLYTDGVTELMDYEHNEYGKTRLVRLTYEHGGGTSADYIQALVTDLEAHRSGFAQSDDITILTARMLPEEDIWPDDL